MHRNTPPIQVVDQEKWLPKTFKDAWKTPEDTVILRDYPGLVYIPIPGVIIKCFVLCKLVEELFAMKFARDYLSLPVPRVLYHPSFPRRLHRRRDFDGISRVWYICMEQCPGVALSQVIDKMPPTQLDHVAEQLKSILHQMATFKPKWLGSVSGAPYLNFFFPGYVAPTRAFASVGDFNDHIRWMLELFCTPYFTEPFLRRFPRNAAMRFTHGDLLPKNIIVNGSKITGIIDWEVAGFYPEYWEYARMHDPMFMTPAWDDLLRRVFPTPRRQEIQVVRDFMNIVNSTF